MEIKESFSVEAAPDQVWSYFADVKTVAECMPGVEVGEVSDDSSFNFVSAVKVGPISVKFEGSATVERDDAARHATITAKGVDKRGGSRANATITYTIAADGSGSRVDIVADVKLSGQVAQFGRTGVMQDISSKMTAEFAGCLSGRLASAHASG